MTDDEKKLKTKKSKNAFSQAKRLSLVPPVSKDSSFAVSDPKTDKSFSSTEKNISPLSSQNLELDLNANLLHLEREAAFFHFALKEIHDLTG